MSQETPTVVLVHGAFADGSSWNGVIERLHAKDVKVTAPANPLRGILIDSAYTASVFEQTPGPVLAVGHSYGGAVITNAATQAKNVVGLVYVAAFAPEEGERLGDASAASKDSILGPALVPRHYPTANGDVAVEFTVDPARLHEVFAADLPDRADAAGRGDPTACSRAGVLRAVRSAGLEGSAVVGRRRPVRQSGGRRRRPIDG